MTIIHVMRQWLVVASPVLAALSAGGSLVYPTVLIEQFKTDSFGQLDMATMTWIGSIHGLAGIPSIFMPHLMQWQGRKLAFITTCVIIMIGWLLAYFSTNIATVLLSESFHGWGISSLLTISQISVTEMLHPKFRNIAILVYGISQSLGMIATGVMARYLHWKIIGLVMFAPITIAMLIAFGWPESPSWLASIGDYEKCEEAFNWLRGTDDGAIKELKELIAAQKTNNSLRERNLKRAPVKNFCRTVVRRDFYEPIFHIIILLAQNYWSGNMVLVIYCIEIINKTTSNGIASFSSIIMNCILMIGFTVNAVLIRMFNNKSVLLTSTLFASIILFVTSIVTYLQTIDILAKDSLVCLYMFIAFMSVSSLGLVPAAFTLAPELMPVKHRGIGGALHVVASSLLQGSSSKSALYLIMYLGLWGTLLLYTINASICGLILWKYLPETKDMSLQEIEYFYMYGTFNKGRHTTDKSTTDNLSVVI